MISLNATLIIQVVNFLLLMWALNRLLFRPILKNLAAREEKISGHVQSADHLSLRAQEVTEEYGRRMGEAQTRALEEREKLRLAGLGEAERVLGEALGEAERSLSETRKMMVQEADKTRKEFGRLSGEISLEICRKVLGAK